MPPDYTRFDHQGPVDIAKKWLSLLGDVEALSAYGHFHRQLSVVDASTLGAHGRTHPSIDEGVTR